jgi:hypothetical protein
MPNPQGKVKSIGGDPYPVLNPRPFYVKKTTEVVITGFGTTAVYTIDGSSVQAGLSLTVSQANNATNIISGVIYVEIGNNASNGDNLTIEGMLISIDDQFIYLAGTPVASFVQGFDGLLGRPLMINLINPSTTTIATSLLQSVYYATLDQTPVTKTVTYRIVSDGISSNSVNTTMIVEAS